MKVLNLYAGIGGNRKLWTDCEVTAVEFNPKIAAIYADLYPHDTVIVGDAHQYLIEHYTEFENGFIWGSPPCPTHSVVNHFLNAQGVIRYPDMSLYQEIIFLQHFFTGKYCIENVKPYYEPLIKPQVSGRHYFWANFQIPKLKVESTVGSMHPVKSLGNRGGGINKNKKRNEHFDLTKVSNVDHTKLLNNCVHPEIGLAIFNQAKGIIQSNSVTQNQLF